jgi:hypothetical protein
MAVVLMIGPIFEADATGHHEPGFASALAEIEEALVPALIVEKLEDGSYTMLVPSVPTPMAGTIYILPPERVYPVDVPFTVALKVFSPEA